MIFKTSFLTKNAVKRKKKKKKKKLFKLHTHLSLTWLNQYKIKTKQIPTKHIIIIYGQFLNFYMILDIVKFCFKKYFFFN